jgi:hypothetical protein
MMIVAKDKQTDSIIFIPLTLLVLISLGHFTDHHLQAFDWKSVEVE